MLFSELPNQTPSDGNFVRERKDFENKNCKVNFEHFSLNFVKPIIEDNDDDGDPLIDDAIVIDDDDVSLCISDSF